MTRLDDIDGRDLPLTIGRYELQRVLGHGAMGRVFLAELAGPSGFRKPVALKVLHGRVDDHDGRRRLVREARIGALLRGPNLVDTYDLEELDGALILVMEYVDGVTLKDLLKQTRLGADAAVELGRQLALGLATAHDLQVQGEPAGLVHRDLKPANVLLDRSGNALIADFGIALLRDAMGDTQIWGSPPYMSPEQTVGTDLDARSDLFALGSVLYEATTGERLFKTAGRRQTVRAIRNSDAFLVRRRVGATLDGLAPGLGALTVRLLGATPDSRPASAHEVVDALDGIRARLSGYGALRRAVRTSLGVGPATRTRRARSPRGLPRVEASFVGRPTELEAGRQALASGSLLAITGPGGVGKSRLALELARSDGRSGHWVDLSRAPGAPAVPRVVAEVLGLPMPRDADQLAQAISRQGPLVVVLDRCDRVRAATGVLLTALAREAPETAVLYTAREALHLPSEAELALEALPLDEAIALLEARSERPLDPRVAGRLAKTLEGLPLSLELAAARLGRTSARELLEAVEAHQVAGLRAGGEARHGVTLERTILWSWATLEPWEQEALHQCSVFRGGFTFDQAAEVLDLSAWPEAPWAVDVVGVLVEKSLVRASVGHAGAPRLDLFAAVADFAADRLQAPGRIQARHLAWFARLGTDSRLAALDATGGDLRIAQVLREAANLQAALDHALETRRLSEACDVTAALLKAEELRGGLQGVGAQVRHLIADPGLHDAARLRLLLAAAAAWRHREGQAYEQLVGQGLDLALALDDPGALAWLRWHQAAIAWAAGRIDEAERRLAEAGAWARADGDPHLELHVLRFEGFVERHRGHLVKACDLHGDGLRLAAALGDVRQEAAHVGALGRCLAAAGKPSEAVVRHEQALRIYRELGDRPGISAACRDLAALHQRAGRLERAEALMREALHLERDLDRPTQVANLLHLLGNHSAARGDLSGALARLDRALDGYRDQGRSGDTAALLADIGGHLLDDGQHERAERVLRQALLTARQVDAPLAVGTAARHLGDLALFRRQTDEAMRHFAEATWAYGNMSDPTGEAVVRGRSALGEAQRGHLKRACRYLSQTVDELQALDEASELVIALTARGHVLHVRGEAQRAQRDWDLAHGVLGAMGLPQDTPLGRRLHALGALLETP